MQQRHGNAGTVHNAQDHPRLSGPSVNLRTKICHDPIKTRRRRVAGFGRRLHARSSSVSPELRRLSQSDSSANLPAGRFSRTKPHGHSIPTPSRYTTIGLHRHQAQAMEFQVEQTSSGGVRRQPPIERRSSFAPSGLSCPRPNKAFSTPNSVDTRIQRGSTVIEWISARTDKLLVVVLGAVALWLLYWFGP